MIKRNIIIVFVMFITVAGFSQNSLNDYKYVVVPNQFEFFKKADKYQLNSLSKFLFNKYGFEAYMKDEKLPDDALINKCLVLKADVLEKKTMFKTKLAIELKNCNDDIVFTTPQGESRIKEYKSSYNEALRNAFNTFSTMNYKYVENKNAFPSSTAIIATKESKVEIEKLKEEIKVLKADKTKAVTESKKTTEQVKTIKNVEDEPKIIKKDDNQLYAQGIDGGFQLVDKAPKVVYTIYYSGKTDVFIVKDRDAIIHKVNGVWAVSEFKNNSMELKALNIKF